jgi:hypothetical protein
VYRSFPPVDETPVQLMVAGRLTSDRRHRLLHALDRLEREYSLPWREGVGLMVQGWWEVLEDKTQNWMLTGHGEPGVADADPLRSPEHFTEQALAERSIYTGMLEVFPLMTLPRLLDFFESQGESILAGHEGRVRRDKEHWLNYEEIVLLHDPRAVEPGITYQYMPWVTLWHGEVINVPESQFKLSERFGVGPLDVPRLLQSKDGRVSFSFTEQNIFRRSGNSWTVRFRGHEQTARHSPGMDHIHKLLSRPREQMDILAFIRPGESGAVGDSLTASAFADRLTASPAAPLPSTDQEAIRQIRDRISQISEEKEQARRLEDLDTEQRLDDELENLTRYLTNETWHGMPKAVAGDRGKARNTVSTAIRRSIEVLGGPIQRHLSDSIEYSPQTAEYRPANDTIWST